ncbi:tRNA methyltransferase complex GCD14 subunit-domain-containing protein [Lipomyces oligophaga]|uniref:tRNA methyltransferase complex GCD14 subunit-domain-containing protein n=1 Tax=Lipomyces oligophaga TaxID=45792 RepID=UPI0034CDC31A
MSEIEELNAMDLAAKDPKLVDEADEQTPSSFIDFQTIIPENGLVLAWITRDNVKPICPSHGQAMHTRFGSFQHNSMIGSSFGMQLASSSATKAGFIHLLHPTPELWSLSLPHRTQIVYTPDAAYIIQRLRIRPGSKVIEAGTGSASFTHALARTVGKQGRVWTFEFHQPRYELAKEDIQNHGLSDIVRCSHGDVCKDGFTHSAGQNLDASAVFLDLPSPWTAIPHLKSVLTKKKLTRICCFSPCMEQVQKTIESLQSEGWLDIEMVEVSCKRWEARKDMVRKAEDAIERIRDVTRKRKEGLEKRNARRNTEAQLDQIDSESDSQIAGTKRAASAEESDNRPFLAADYNPWGKGQRIHEGQEGFEWRKVSRVETELKTHTSYLTFAYLPPPMA